MKGEEREDRLEVAKAEGFFNLLEGKIGRGREGGSAIAMPSWARKATGFNSIEGVGAGCSIG